MQQTVDLLPLPFQLLFYLPFIKLIIHSIFFLVSNFLSHLPSYFISIFPCIRLLFLLPLPLFFGPYFVNLFLWLFSTHESLSSSYSSFSIPLLISSTPFFTKLPICSTFFSWSCLLCLLVNVCVIFWGAITRPPLRQPRHVTLFGVHGEIEVNLVTIICSSDQTCPLLASFCQANGHQGTWYSLLVVWD